MFYFLIQFQVGSVAEELLAKGVKTFFVVLCGKMGRRVLSCPPPQTWFPPHRPILHSPREIISTAGKTGHDARWKRKQSLKLFIHISNKSASIKTKDVPIKSSKLLCLNLILFCSKSCKLKTFPAVISRVFIFVMNGPSQKALFIKWSHL